MQFSFSTIIALALLAPTISLAAPAPVPAPGLFKAKEVGELRLLFTGLSPKTGFWNLEQDLKKAWGKPSVVKVDVKTEGGTGKSAEKAIVQMKDAKEVKKALAAGAPTVDGKKPSIVLCTFDLCGQ